MTYLEIGRLGPDVPVVADDGGLAEVAGADELIIYVGLPRHGAFTFTEAREECWRGWGLMPQFTVRWRQRFRPSLPCGVIAACLRRRGTSGVTGWRYSRMARAGSSY